MSSLVLVLCAFCACDDVHYTPPGQSQDEGGPETSTSGEQETRDTTARSGSTSGSASSTCNVQPEKLYGFWLRNLTDRDIHIDAVEVVQCDGSVLYFDSIQNHMSLDTPRGETLGAPDFSCDDLPRTTHHFEHEHDFIFGAFDGLDIDLFDSSSAYLQTGALVRVYAYDSDCNAIDASEGLFTVFFGNDELRCEALWRSDGLFELPHEADCGW